MIIAFGIVNGIELSKSDDLPKPTLHFGLLSQELQYSNSGTIENLSTIRVQHSFEKDLRVFQELAKPQRVGVFVEKGLADNLSLDATFAKIATKLEIELPIIAFSSLEEIRANLDGLDAAYLASGFYLSDSEVQELAEILIQLKMPSFTSTMVNDVKNGLLATYHNQSEINQSFRRIALSVESVINGGEMKQFENNILGNDDLTVNFSTANRIGLEVKYSLIARTNFIGEPMEESDGRKYSLVMVMEEAIAENLALKTQAQELELSEKELQFSKSNYLPDLTANGGGAYIDPDLAEVSAGRSPELTTTGNLTLNQTLYSQAATANIGIQKALRDAQAENYKSEALNTVYNSATAYFTALILKANLNIQVKNLELTKYNLKIAIENYEAGQAGKSDVLRFKSEMAQNTQEMIQALNQLQQAYNNLNLLLNNPIESKIDVEEAELKEGVFSDYNYERLGNLLDDPSLRGPFQRFLIEEAKRNAPELKALDYNLKATEKSENLYGVGRLIPTVGLQGQYNQEFSRSGVGTEYPPLFSPLPLSYYTVGLSVSVPLFNQNKQNVNKQIASIQKDQLETSRANLELSIARDVNDAILEMINQIANIKLSKVFEETAAEALDLTQTAYASGAVNIVQLLDAQNNYLQSQLASTNANYNYLSASMRLERFLGSFFLLQTQQERDDFIQRFLDYSQQDND